MSHEKRYTAKQAAFAVLAKTEELLKNSSLAKGAWSGSYTASPRAKGVGGHETGHEKGVHSEHSILEHKGAVAIKQSGNRDEKRITPPTKEAHKQKLGEMKAMPKPDLPKSEEGMAKSEQLCKAHAVDKKEGFEFAKSENCTVCKSEGVGSKKIGGKPSELGAQEKEPEKTDEAYDVEPGKKEMGQDPRLAEQKAPGANPKEEAEGNNELPGTTPNKVGQDGKNMPGYDEIKGHLKLAKFIGRMEHKRGQKKMPHGA